MRRAVFCFGILALAMCSFLPAATLYVDASAPAGGNGQAWSTAFTDLQAALDIAQSGDEIRVAHGTYKPTKQTNPPNPRSAMFQLISGTTLKGGYAGVAGPDPDARDFTAHETILSGDLNGDDDPTKALNDPARNNEENCYRIINGETDISGFTIEGGNANGALCSFGAAIGDGGSGGIILDCTFRGNHGDGDGGAISATGNVQIIRCKFFDNHANCGGAIYSTSSIALIERCLFSQNSASSNGGAVRFYANSYSVTVENSIFLGNTSTDGAAIDFGVVGISPHVVNCTFYGNSATNAGGGDLQPVRQPHPHQPHLLG
ncbi:MAG TPA: right-handed parallel beta-helix repeat-containing protein [Planctomycetota bacterium]